MENYLPGRKASEILGVHQRTLYCWEKKGLIDTIRTPGGKRMYNVKKYLEQFKTTVSEDNTESDNDNENKINICYCRVSSIGQKDDLVRQKEFMKEKYPNNMIIEDIGSGLNFKRKGLNKIIKMAIDGKINTVVVAHKDRLTRFGYEMIEMLVRDYSNGKIVIVNQENLAPEEDMMKDMLQIMNVFVAKMNGMRKYKKIEK